MTQNLVADKIKAKVPAGDIPPEVELILCCARTKMDAANSERIKALLREDLDWAYLIQTAARHRIIPLLYQSLKNTCPEAVPKTILNQLRGDFHSNAVYNLLLTKELLKLLALFKDHDIAAIPFKGQVLAALVYGNLALREFGDLDILVHKRDFLRAKDLLICQGYRHQYFGEHEAAYLQSQLVRADGKISVDLHWGITPRDFCFSLAPEPMMEHLKPVSLGDITVLTFSPEDSLLILYVHGTKEGWSSLNRICDVAELIRAHPKMNWELILKQVKTLGHERRFLVSLLLTRNFLGTVLPEEILQRIQAIPVIKSLAASVGKKLFCEADFQPGIFEILRNNIEVIDHEQDRVRCFLQITTAPTSIERAFLPLPPFLSFLYYLVRPIRLIGKYGSRLLKH